MLNFLEKNVEILLYGLSFDSRFIMKIKSVLDFSKTIFRLRNEIMYWSSRLHNCCHAVVIFICMDQMGKLLSSERLIQKFWYEAVFHTFSKLKKAIRKNPRFLLYVIDPTNTERYSKSTYWNSVKVQLTTSSFIENPWPRWIWFNLTSRSFASSLVMMSVGIGRYPYFCPPK